MDFVEWLVTTQRRKDTPVGDLARDLHADRCLPPEAQSPEAVLVHIQGRHHACQGAIEAVRDARRLWKAACRRDGLRGVSLPRKESPDVGKNRDC